MASVERANQGNSLKNQKVHPCVLCQQRKVKCDRNEPCSNCIKANVECIPAPVLQPRKRKRRFPEAELLERLRRYEHHLRSLGADVDTINRESIREGNRSASTATTTIKSNCSHSSSPLHYGLPESHPARSLSVRRSLRHVEK